MYLIENSVNIPIFKPGYYGRLHEVFGFQRLLPDQESHILKRHPSQVSEYSKAQEHCNCIATQTTTNNNNRSNKNDGLKVGVKAMQAGAGQPVQNGNGKADHDRWWIGMLVNSYTGGVYSIIEF
jgi:hypothetical protein